MGKCTRTGSNTLRNFWNSKFTLDWLYRKTSMKRLQTNVDICVENYELGKEKSDKLKLDAEMRNGLFKGSREYSKFKINGNGDRN